MNIKLFVYVNKISSYLLNILYVNFAEKHQTMSEPICYSFGSGIHARLLLCRIE
jgi:hypothetical protein